MCIVSVIIPDSSLLFVSLSNQYHHLSFYSSANENPSSSHCLRPNQNIIYIQELGERLCNISIMLFARHLGKFWLWYFTNLIYMYSHLGMRPLYTIIPVRPRREVTIIYPTYDPIIIIYPIAFPLYYNLCCGFLWFLVIRSTIPSCFAAGQTVPRYRGSAKALSNNWSVDHLPRNLKGLPLIK